MGGDRWGWRREFEYLARFMGTVEINRYIIKGKEAEDDADIWQS